MKRIVDDERLMVQVSRQYYDMGIGQKEIADGLGLSRPTVSKLLQGARDRGIVRIFIADIDGRNHMEMEKQLEEKYGLKAMLITDSHEDPSQMKNQLGRAMAKYLERIVNDGDIIGISMGSTLSYIAQHISPQGFGRVRVVPMVGGIGKANIEWHANSIAEAMAKHLGGQALSLHAPAMVSRIQAKEELMREDSISSVLEIAANVDIALNGIGAPDERSSMISTGYMGDNMLDLKRQHDLCGDVCLRFYNEQGRPTFDQHNQRVIGVDIDTLKTTEWSFGIGGGANKAGALKGAVAGKYINAIVTDYACARELLGL